MDFEVGQIWQWTAKFQNEESSIPIWEQYLIVDVVKEGPIIKPIRSNKHDIINADPFLHDYEYWGAEAARWIRVGEERQVIEI